jgi:hypothetical protein
MRVTVTVEDLDYLHPLDRAFQRALGHTVTVRGDRAYSAEHGFSSYLPLDVQRWCFEHRRGGVVAPFSFEATNLIQAVPVMVGRSAR